MILDWSKVRVFVKPGATDMRKQINGLSIIVSEDLEMDPFEGNLFRLKRLEKDKFPWPMNRSEATEITQEQFSFLLQGIDFWNVHKKLNYSSIF